MLPKLVEVLECSEAELLGAPAPKVKRGPPSEWEKRINAIKELPREKQREIQNVVDALIAKAISARRARRRATGRSAAQAGRFAIGVQRL